MTNGIVQIERDLSAARRDALLLHTALASAIRRMAAVHERLAAAAKSWSPPMRGCRAMHAVAIGEVKYDDLLAVLGQIAQPDPNLPDPLNFDSPNANADEIGLRMLYDVLLAGDFYKDHDDSARLLGFLRRHIERHCSLVA
jgi:hypothetical protein